MVLLRFGVKERNAGLIVMDYRKKTRMVISMMNRCLRRRSNKGKVTA